MAKTKPGLNQRCPCGSGLKFKKCCFHAGASGLCRPNADGKEPMPVASTDCGKGCRQEEECDSCHHVAANPTRTTSSSDRNVYSPCRFRVGDQVWAAMGTRVGFQQGTVVALDYRETGWLGSVPYQIQLHSPNAQLIYAPFDTDEWVRMATDDDTFASSSCMSKTTTFTKQRRRQRHEMANGGGRDE